MKLNSKVTGGLAWAGLALVLAVPSADMLTKPSVKSATITSDMDAIQTASVTPAAKPVVPAIKAPAGTDADYFILSFARELDAAIVSNDRFKDRIAAFPEVEEDMIRYMIVADEVVFERRSGRRQR